MSEKRLRRLRMTAPLRRMVRETQWNPQELVYPVFVVEGQGVRKEIASMPGIFNLSVDSLIEEIDPLCDAGLSSVLVFGIPDAKDDRASGAYSDSGIVQRAVTALRQRFPGLLVITDVCLCEYTSHGHCGIIEGDRILNDPTVEILARTAVSHARAGADMVAPSDMMDLRVGAIRGALDEAGFLDLPIMAYSAKFASSFYGPFRDAAQSAPAFGDRKSHQLNPANTREALAEIDADIAEGADIVMVKPALAYLDLVRLARDRYQVPVAAYNVSGEYSMIKAAAEKGWIDEPRAVWEMLTSIKRAGADVIISYFAKDLLSGRLPFEY